MKKKKEEGDGNVILMVIPIFMKVKKRGRGNKMFSQLAFKNISRNIHTYAAYFLSENVMLE